ncbi:MAG TPA: alpha/beta hydrolase [Candidatus Dormibacteraeota bacterium]|nr:alpha/beta hydrolase [Candidatus Dormibacteraeota bacterium]
MQNPEQSTQSLTWPMVIRNVPGSILRLRGTFTPPIGTPNGIAELRPVLLNGHPQWLLIRGADKSNPLLLYVPGGPGESNIWAAHYTMREVERHFVCVNWDPRGASKSLHPAPDPATMTIDQFVKDTIALIEVLLQRFDRKKLLLIGHSWGSFLAMKVAAARPELLYAVIGMGQEVDNRRGEEISYRYAVERARAAGDRSALRTLQQLGGSDTYTKSGKFVERMLLFRLGGLMHTGGIRAVLAIMLSAPEFSIAECVRYARNEGTAFSIPLMADELMKLNLLTEVKELEVPVFLFEGKYDYTAPYELAEEFFAALKAPHKRLVWFEESGHPMDVEEPEKFQREVIAIGAECCCDAPRVSAARG